MKLTIILALVRLATALDLPPLPDWYDKSKLPPGIPGVSALTRRFEASIDVDLIGSSRVYGR
tara:strand:- start:387 stop:572 length:186 start_codon:yes stop_codon:yes gene_type:complete